ncbi:hypothetical protein BV22DRAFT_1132418 [Leucogyrophana mollusca]|uniref:Uncharacterized protein n=1 Tax=Leucogyrophana mollusca TaxID=85980 RepID=A0ACB8B794_9AGAM|nr:hypothetical protein BV22DRAFT_1132418 [Leucogyrophana mollusca]
MITLRPRRARKRCTLLSIAVFVAGLLYFLWRRGCCSHSEYADTPYLSLAEEMVRAMELAIDDTVRSTALTEHKLPLTSASGLQDLQRFQAELAAHMHASNNTTDTDVDICPALAGHRLLLVGTEQAYALHSHLLRRREQSEGYIFPCAGKEFCTHHRVCVSHSPQDGERENEKDQEKERYVKSPTPEELERTGEVLVTFVLSSGLAVPLDGGEKSGAQEPVVDPATGVRVREAYPPWTTAVRRVKTGVIVLSRGAVPAPAWSYAGNWTFLDSVPRVGGAPLVPASNGTRGSIAWSPGGSMTQTLRGPATQPAEDVPALRIANAALHATLRTFLPGVLRALGEARQTHRRRVVWAGGWLRARNRVGMRNAEFEREDVLFQLVEAIRVGSDAIKSDSGGIKAGSDAIKADPWTLYHDVQVYLQNRLLRGLLPHFEVVFLPLEGGARVRGRGGADGARKDEGGAEARGGEGVRSREEVRRKEKEEAIGDAFLRGLVMVMRYGTPGL